ncbi:MAG: DUF721 domain-containing protein [Treponema sp.]|nr:DUF721 domain-containing protein [Treponema sp.]
MNDFITSSDIMLKIADFKSYSEGKEITSVWKNVVSKIKSYQSDDDAEMTLGEKLSASTRVIDFKNGVLLIETDHSGWIQYLNFYKKFIIKGIKMAIPELKISSLAFRVAGSDIKLNDNYEEDVEKSWKKMEEKLDAQEEAVKKYVEKKNEKKEDLPPELASKFESIIQNMLTNSENK